MRSFAEKPEGDIAGKYARAQVRSSALPMIGSIVAREIYREVFPCYRGLPGVSVRISRFRVACGGGCCWMNL